MRYLCTFWGFSSVGRASDLHSEGQEFESPNLQEVVPGLGLYGMAALTFDEILRQPRKPYAKLHMADEDDTKDRKRRSC